MVHGEEAVHVVFARVFARGFLTPWHIVIEFILAWRCAQVAFQRAISNLLALRTLTVFGSTVIAPKPGLARHFASARCCGCLWLAASLRLLP